MEKGGREKGNFRRVPRKATKPRTPRELFRNLERDDSVPFLWEHQGKLLERYEKDHLGTQDVALELPTGTGKTLIGLLIAEWRRQNREERTVYLCPTRQLANQVASLAPAYGIPARACLRPGYDGLDEWKEGRIVAVTTYSSIFNYRSRFEDPEALILDDAHAAENYVADHWTVTIQREKLPELYARLLTLLDPLLDRRMADLMADDSPKPSERSAVELVPVPRWWPLADALRDEIEEGVQDTDAFYSWDAHVREGLAACCLLVSWDAVVLRPVIPPTAYQPEFDDVAQRVYMSATLGASGELERIFGVRKIERLPAPEEWERHATGRRLFLMPTASLRQQDTDRVVVDSIKRAGRALVLAPTHRRVERRREMLQDAGIPTLGAGDIEQSLTPFTGRDQGALVLANRYDGIDLPRDDCRLLILDGLPIAINALEQFLYSRLSATGLLGERMRTRLTQGVGRCSRGEGDWCAVLFASREVYDLCAKRNVRELLHPELQGELQFGLEQSRDREADEFLDLFDTLLDHGEDWAEAEAEIRELRDGAVRRTDPAAAKLAAVVADEVGYVYALWNSDYPLALEKAAAVADGLNGNEAAAYRAWWFYLAGCAAWYGHHALNIDGMLPRARDLFKRAATVGRSVRWFAELAYGELGEEAELEIGKDDLQAVERIDSRLRRIGFNGRGFARRKKQLAERLAGTDPTPFEEGLTELGRLLGWDANHPSGTADPDSVWIASEQLAIVWEAKSDESADGEIGANTARQAASHVDWLHTHHQMADNAVVIPILVSDRTRLSKAALPHIGDVRVVTMGEMRTLANETTAALARIRALGEAEGDGGQRSRLVEQLAHAELLPSDLIDRLASRELAALA